MRNLTQKYPVRELNRNLSKKITQEIKQKYSVNNRLNQEEATQHTIHLAKYAWFNSNSENKWLKSPNYKIQTQ